MSLIQVDIVTQKLGADAIYTEASKDLVKNVLVCWSAFSFEFYSCSNV